MNRAYLKRFRLIVVIFRVYRGVFFFFFSFSLDCLFVFFDIIQIFPRFSRGINQVVHRKLADVVIDIVLYSLDDAFAMC